VLLTTAAAVVALIGPFGDWVAENTGLGTGALDVWSWIRWPILLAIGLLMFGLLYRFGPSSQRASWWRLLTGAIVGVALWIAASAGFSVYLTHFASYNRVYGALGAAVAFLVWAWVMNIALLVGVEVNRGLERPKAGAPTSHD
jgi:membrane protein